MFYTAALEAVSRVHLTVSQIKFSVIQMCENYHDKKDFCLQTEASVFQK